MSVFGFLKEFISPKPNINKLKLQKQGLEREKRATKHKYESLRERQKNLVSQIVSARKQGDNLTVNYLWDEIRSAKQEAAFLGRESKKLNLEGLALGRFITGLEVLQTSKNPNSIKNFIKKMGVFTTSKIVEHDVNEKEYISELDSIMDMFGLEVDDYSLDDPEKDKFLNELDIIITAENEGDIKEKQEELIKKILEEATD